MTTYTEEEKVTETGSSTLSGPVVLQYKTLSVFSAHDYIAESFKFTWGFPLFY